MFTDIFIKRPVLASVVSLLILLLGFRAILDLPVRQFPKTENTLITVTTAYPGASSDVIQGFVTSPIEKSVASADGIDYLTASSNLGVSTISAYVRLNFDPNTAFTSVMSKVAQVRNQLPTAVEDPVIVKSTGDTIALMYMSFSSNEMTPEQITDYVSRVVQPQLETVPGVASAEILGGKVYAMRIWLNQQRMAALKVAPSDVFNALLANNYLSTAGQTKGQYVAFPLNSQTDLHDQKQFENLIIKSTPTTIIYLKDVAKVLLGSEDYDSNVNFNGKKAIFIGIKSTPTANPLTVIGQIRVLFPELLKNFPPSLKGDIVYDATNYIRASIKEVVKTIAEATVIVILVIFLFLGSIRSVIIPVVTIPLSLVGVCTLMLVLGYSINLLTLLAMVLAIGMVVDDAIVVVENVHRHIEEGLSPFQAAIKGAREIATPIIAMTITLAAVYAPIGFLTGLTGALFKEFAFTLASAVIISGVIALTLSPMMCSKVLTSTGEKNRFEMLIEKNFERLKVFYEKRLHNMLDFRVVTLFFAIVVLTSCYFLFTHTSQELAPDEDQSVLFVSATAPQYANIDYSTLFSDQLNAIYKSFPETQDYFIVNGANGPSSIISGIILKPWDERKTTQQQLNPLVQEKVRKIAGLNIAVFPLPPLPGNDGLPLQFVIKSIGDYRTLFQVSQQLLDAARKSGLFMFVDSDLKYENPQINISIDRQKVALMGINMQDVAQTLGTVYSGAYTNFFSMEGQSYQVIPLTERKFRLNPGQFENIYMNTESDKLVPLSTFVTSEQTVQPNSLNEFQQLNSATISGLMMPGMSLGDGVNFLKAKADNLLPRGMQYDYAGQTRQFVQEGGSLIYTFFLAVIVIYLVLAAQFESFRDPFVILVSVPMSICGALIFLNLGLATINIYTQVGLITLIGLISKHGILMVDFANKLQLEEGLSMREAIEKAASIRLRPILMTTAAMIMGVVPLILATGAGAKSRFDIGLVIATGMAIGTLFTLFVVPTMYTYFSAPIKKLEKQ